MSASAVARAIEMRGIKAVPEGWDVLPLKTFLRSRAERGNEDLPLLSVYRDHGVVPFGSIEGNYNKPSLDLSGYKTVREGDLVLNKMKTWQGSLAVSDYEGIVSPAYVVCQVFGSWDRRYLHHLLRSPSFVAEYASLSYGIRVGQWDMRFEDFREVLALHPPLEIQRRIVDYLDSETARIDALIDRKQRFIDLLLEKRAALITHAVTKGLDPDVETRDSGTEWFGRIPAHWRMDRFPRVIDLREGPGILSPDFRDEGTPLLKVGNLTGDVVTLEGCFYLDPRDVAEKWQRFVLQEGDLLISGSASLGGSSIVPPEASGCVPYTGVIRLRPNERRMHRPFVRYMLWSTALTEQVRLLSAGVGIKHFGPSHLSRVWVPLPPLDEQVRIAQSLDEDTRLVDGLVAQTRRSIELLREYRTALISAAVTGQIDIPGTDETEGVA